MNTNILHFDRVTVPLRKPGKLRENCGKEKVDDYAKLL